MPCFGLYPGTPTFCKIKELCCQIRAIDAHVLLRREGQYYLFCLHVLIAHRIFINLGHVDYFQ